MVNPPTALAAAQPIEPAPVAPKVEPVVANPAPAIVVTPTPVKFYSRGTTQGLRNNVIHSPNQPRPDLMQP